MALLSSDISFQSAANSAGEVKSVENAGFFRPAR
jgi:hypothetical protein